MKVIVPKSKTYKHQKGDCILSPLTPIINLVPMKDVPEGETTISWDPKCLSLGQ